MAQNVMFLPSMGASRGILIAASDRFFRLHSHHATTNTISAKITMLAENIEWSITGAYGLQGDNENNFHAGDHRPETTHAPCMAIAWRLQLNLLRPRQEQRTHQPDTT